MTDDPAQQTSTVDSEVEQLNDRLAHDHPINEYYSHAPWPMRWIEQRRLTTIGQLVGPPAGLELLEVGVGGGHVLERFRDGRLTATDVSTVYLDLARERLASLEVRFLHGELERLRLPPRSFDRVICSEVIEHVVDPDGLLREIARVLKPDGWAVITVPNDPLIARLKKIARWLPPWRGGAVGNVEWGGQDYHLHRWSPAQFSRLLNDHFHVAQYAPVPSAHLPIRLCYRCEPLPTTPLQSCRS